MRVIINLGFKLAILTLIIAAFKFSPPQRKFDRMDTNAKVKTLFMYNFAKYIKWPDNYEKGDFIIGIYGDYPSLEYELTKMAHQRKINGRYFEIKKFESIRDFRYCHLLYVAQQESYKMSDVLKNIGNQQTLIVTDQKGMARNGACVNLIYENNRQRMEINPKNAEERGLKISGSLLHLAKIVK